MSSIDHKSLVDWIQCMATILRTDFDQRQAGLVTTYSPDQIRQSLGMFASVIGQIDNVYADLDRIAELPVPEPDQSVLPVPEPDQSVDDLNLEVGHTVYGVKFSQDRGPMKRLQQQISTLAKLDGVWILTTDDGQTFRRKDGSIWLDESGSSWLLSNVRPIVV